MAKKKLFGNAPEARCETCALGKTSAEGDVVLCKRAGAVPLDHRCRRFRYDPLKRTPRRTKLLDTFDEKDFSLDIAVEEPVEEPVEETVVTAEIMETAEVVDTAEVVEAVTEEATEAVVTEEPADNADDTPADDNDDKEVSTTSEESANVFLPDNTDDIFSDLARLDIELTTSSTQAAFRGFEPKIVEAEQEDDSDILDAIDDFIDPTSLMFTESSELEEHDTLDEDALVIFGDFPDEDDTEMLTMDEDGTISTISPDELV